MKNLYNFKKSYSLISALWKAVVLIFILSFVIFSLLFDLQLNQLSRAFDKINPLTQAEEYRIKNISFAESSYQNGFLEFSAENLRENDSIVLSEENSEEQREAVIISDQKIYKVIGSEMIMIGVIDHNFNGQNGRKLRINFYNDFKNGDFNSAEYNNKIPGWKTVDKEIEFGEDKIAGHNTPGQKNTSEADFNQSEPANSNHHNGSFKTELMAKSSSPEDYFLRISIGDINAKTSQSVIRGPAVYSDREVYLDRNDELIFDWKAVSGSDAYSIYGYLLDVDNNYIQTIIDKTGKDKNANSDWKKERVRVSAPGRYIVVFVGGSYDFTGGRAVGADFYIDNLKIEKESTASIVTADDLNKIAKKIVYKKSSVSPFANNQLSIKVENNNGQVAEEKIVFNHQKDNIVLARDNQNLLSTKQDKSGPAQPAANFTLEKYNHKNPERVDKLIINNDGTDRSKTDDQIFNGKQNFTANIYIDQNENGIVDKGELKAAEAVQITFKAESISRDESGNYQLTINPNSKTEIAMNIVLDLENIQNNDQNRLKGSQKYIIEINP